MIARPQESYAMAFIGDLHQKSRTPNVNAMFPNACSEAAAVSAMPGNIVRLLAKRKKADYETYTPVTIDDARDAIGLMHEAFGVVDSKANNALAYEALMTLLSTAAIKKPVGGK